MRYKFLFYFVIITNSLFAQFAKDYTPLVYTGSVPADFNYQPQKVIAQNISDDKILEKKWAKIFYTSVSYSVQRTLTSGKVYYNDPLSTYLNEIATTLISSKPELSGKIEIYAARSAVINAESLPDGHIFINIGLINAMDNEHQLASIIAHEIAHYANKHAATTYKRRLNISKQQTSEDDQEGDTYRRLGYSRENEFEADAFGLQLMIASPFDASEALAALNNLRKSDSADVPMDLEKYFNSELFTIDTNWINEKAIKTWVKNASKRDENVFLDNKTEDILLSHPDIEKRVLALSEILKATEYKYTGKKEASDRFNELKKTASFEVVENSHRNGQYAFSIYQSLKLLETYPDNLFLNINIIRSLYWLCHMREIDALEKVIQLNGLATGKNYDKLNTFLSKPGISEYKKLSYGFLKQRMEKFKSEDDFAFYKGLITEQYLGKEAAAVHYRAYQMQFPSGKNIHFVNRKLKTSL